MSKISIPSIVFTSSLISKIWEDKANLKENERRGLYSFIYLNLCGYVESIISFYLMNLLDLEIEHIKHLNRFDSPESNKFEKMTILFDDKEVVFSTESQKQMVLRILNNKKSEIEKSTLNELINTSYTQITGKRIDEVITLDGKKILESLRALRNILAHGRDLYTKFEVIELDEEFKIMMDYSYHDHPLKEAVDLLKNKNVFTQNKISEQGNSILEIFYSEKVVIYYYDSVKNIDKVLRSLLKPQTGIFLTFSGELPVLDK